MNFVQYFVLFVQTIIVKALLNPPYKVDLHQSEEFIIGDDFNNENYFDPEDEMIQLTDKLDKEKPKLQLLHTLVKRYNDKINENTYYLKNKTHINAEQSDIYYDSREFEPNQAGFIDKYNNFILNQENKNVYYFNQITKQLIASEIKENHAEKRENDYNYEELNKEYQIEVNKELQLNETFNSTNIKENESLKESFDQMIDFKSTPRNCTAEELQGIGFGAVKCVWLDLEKSETKETRLQIFQRIKRIIYIWFAIYAAIAVPLWCHKGWCCCCCRCKVCRPIETIDEAKKYYMDAPPGVFLTKNGEKITYEPNIYEINAYLKLERVLMTL